MSDRCEPGAIAAHSPHAPAQLRPSAHERLQSLVGRMIGSWVCWREACEDVRSAYARWWQCNKPAQRDQAFASYCAALEREDQAARVYSIHAERVREASA